MKKQLIIGCLALGMGIAVQAVPLVGNINFDGGATLNGPLATATSVTAWLDGGGALPKVTSRSGDFVGLVAVGATVTFTAPWSFASGAVTPFWTIAGGFPAGITFDLISSAVALQNSSFLNVSGTGTIKAPGFGPTVGTFFFSTQGSPAGSIFSFSAGDSFVPDGGATLGLLGLALVGVEALRRKMSVKA